ncbi:MAG: hypothetical protein H7239_01050 [Flavobacterium sp.]|nr:hypothetical protein [Flavobacterium sp.]
MKLKSIIVSLLISIILFSCKNEDKNNSSLPDNNGSVEKPLLDKSIFTVTLNAIVQKDDSFQLYYKYNDNEPFDEKKSLFIEFKGSQQPQDIVFRLPKDEIPNFLRLDFGTNKNQDKIEIKSFKMNYLDKKVEIKGTDFFNYFYPNPLTEKTDAKLGTLTPIISKDGGYDPMVASAEGLSKQIQTIIK